MLKNSQLNYAEIMSNFPKFELSYGTMIHNKVHDSDIILAISEGAKMFAWFTEHNEENVCFIWNAEEKSGQPLLQIAVTSFDDKLVSGKGTILYGTIFKYNGVSCFCIEDIYYYKGQPLSDSNYHKRLMILRTCLEKELCSNALTNEFTIFGLPIMNTNFSMLLQDIGQLPYAISTIQFRYFNSKKIVYVKYFKPKDRSLPKDKQGFSKEKDSRQVHSNKCDYAIFNVSPQIQSDIYNLFAINNGKEDFFDIAFISDYKTSVLMNKLFRNIKENRNLDLLEESDDDDEFENEKEDKFVFLERILKMNCQYNYKFKKWMPISLASKNDRIISLNRL